MTITFIDVVDTAVKIGLGAIIAGVITLKVTRLNHNKDMNKALQNRKWDF